MQKLVVAASLPRPMAALSRLYVKLHYYAETRRQVLWI
jgi:hypothetical protein